MIESLITSVCASQRSHNTKVTQEDPVDLFLYSEPRYDATVVVAVLDCLS